MNILNYAHQFSRLLSYSLKHNNYFKEEEKNSKNYTIPIHDLSPGGLSIKHENNYYEVEKYIHPGWDERNKFDIDLDQLALIKDDKYYDESRPLVDKICDSFHWKLPLLRL